MPYTRTWTPTIPLRETSRVSVKTWDNKRVPQEEYTYEISGNQISLTVEHQNRYTVSIHNANTSETARIDFPEAQNSTSVEERLRRYADNTGGGSGTGGGLTPDPDNEGFYIVS